MDNTKLHFETLQLHAGQEQPDPTTGARAVPIYQTTSYVFRDAKHAADRFALRDAGNIYGRLTNDTQAVFETRMAALEGGVAALAVASGAAAITYALQNILRPGDHIVAADNLYGGSYNLIVHTLAAMGINHTIVSINDLIALDAAIRPETKVVFAETFGNPNSEVTDIRGVSEVAHRHHVPLLIDNTFGTPFLIRPIEHGADIVVHSATKFIGGHGTTLGGVIVDGARTLLSRGGFHPCGRAGCVRHPHSCRAAAGYRGDIGSPQCLSALARSGNPFAPCGTAYFPNGGGSIFTFEIKGGQDAAWRFIDSLQIFSLLANVADVKSLVIHPATTTHSQLSSEELAAQHITPSTVRLSIGTEHIEDLLADLEQALEKAGNDQLSTGIE